MRDCIASGPISFDMVMCMLLCVAEEGGFGRDGSVELGLARLL